MRVNPVIGLSGQLGSGKSSLASILAERSSWQRAAFGDYLRHLANQRGLETDRVSLQQLGEEQIALGWDAFCSAVLNHFEWRPGRGLVVDGIRHVDAVRTLNRLMYPQRLFLVHLAIDEEIRHGRLALRDGTQAFLMSVEEHTTEADVKDALPRAADMVVDAARPVELLADEVLDVVMPTKPSRTTRPMIAFTQDYAQVLSAMYRPEWN